MLLALHLFILHRVRARLSQSTFSTSPSIPHPHNLSPALIRPFLHPPPALRGLFICVQQQELNIFLLHGSLSITIMSQSGCVKVYGCVRMCVCVCMCE